MLHLTTTLGTLSCQVLQGDDAPPRAAVVLCHGYGAPGDDLVALGGHLIEGVPALAKGVRFVFPAAPLTMPQLGYGDARAWWEIDLDRRIRLQQQGGDAHEGLRDEVPPGLTKARRALMGTLDALQQTSGLPLSRVVLGGFSQGAMLTTDVTFALDEAPAGLAILSGTLISQKDWRAKAPRRKGLRVFQSHGRFDPILRFQDAEALKELLKESGLEVEFLPFDNVHTIPPEALTKLAKFLEGTVPSSG